MELHCSVSYMSSVSYMKRLQLDVMRLVVRASA